MDKVAAAIIIPATGPNSGTVWLEGTLLSGVVRSVPFELVGSERSGGVKL